MIKVIVAGAAGKMGQTVCRAVLAESDLNLVGGFDVHETALYSLPELEGKLKATTLKGLLSQTKADVLVDFTQANAVLNNVRVATEAGLHAVIGTTGISAVEIDELMSLAQKNKRNILLAPNFAIGAVLMMKLAAKIAPYFERVEIIELHHDQKADAPSGTAIMTAELLADRLKAAPLNEQEKFAGARGAKVKDIPVHSVRLPGLVAHQEVIFGLKGQVLTIRHDSIDRTSFMPGVLKAIREIKNLPGFTYGLDKLLEL